MSAADMYYEYEVRGGMSVKTESAIFLADLDCCFFHFRDVDSRFVDLVPRTYNTFFLVLKCAGKT